MTTLGWIECAAAVMAILWLGYSLWLVKKGWNVALPAEFKISDIKKNFKIQQILAWTVWTLVPPVWFLFEHLLYDEIHPDASKEALESFKYNQDLASKIWIAVAAVLLALYFGKDLKNN